MFNKKEQEERLKRIQRRIITGYTIPLDEEDAQRVREEIEDPCDSDFD